MKTVTITLDNTELVKLISVCGSAIADEQKTLNLLKNNPVNFEVVKHTEASINNIEAIRNKLKKAVTESIGLVTDSDDMMLAKAVINFISGYYYNVDGDEWYPELKKYKSYCCDDRHLKLELLDDLKDAKMNDIIDNFLTATIVVIRDEIVNCVRTFGDDGYDEIKYVEKLKEEIKEYLSNN